MEQKTRKRAVVITAVGAGGKTTYLENRAADCSRRGLRAALTTTTHIWKPEGTDIPAAGCGLTGTGDGPYVFRGKNGIDYIGTPEASGKLCAPPAAVWDRICMEYDAVFVEGDGSHCMPVKIPGPGEPVIPDGTDEIAVIMGKQAVGRRLSVVCHRYDEDRLPDGMVTDRMLEEIAQDFYLRPLREQYPGADIFYAPSAYESEETALSDLPVTAVLLASGFGRRYGGNKLVEDLDGKPLYRHALEHVTQALGKERTVVVTQYREILEAVRYDGIRALQNDDAAEGICASIRIGTQEALEREGSEAVLFFAADMPFLPAEEIRRYARQFLWSGKTYGCMESGPVHTMTNPGAFRLYDAKKARTPAAGQLLSLHGDRGAMRIMKEHPQDVFRYQVAEEAVRDIDVRT